MNCVHRVWRWTFHSNSYSSICFLINTRPRLLFSSADLKQEPGAPGLSVQQTFTRQFRSDRQKKLALYFKIQTKIKSKIPSRLSQVYTSVKRKKRTWSRRTKTDRANWSSGGVAPTSPWSSWTSWSGSSTRRTTRTRSWERSWASGWACPRPGCRWGDHTSNPKQLFQSSCCCLESQVRI